MTLGHLYFAPSLALFSLHTFAFLQTYIRTVVKTSIMAGNAMNGGNFSHNNTAAPSATRVMPLFSLKGRTAIVSGAGAGIGLAVAHCLAEAGANVAIWYNSNKKAIAEAEKIEKEYGVKCMLHRFCWW